MRKRSRLAILLALALGAQASSGCASYLTRTDTRSSLSEPAQLAAERVEEDMLPPPLREGALPEMYGSQVDPRLAPLVAEAIGASPDVVVAVSTVEEARAIAEQTRAARLPTVSAQASGTVSHNIVAGIGAVDARSAVFSLPVAYEVDLTARYAREHQASRDDVHAAEADADAAALAVAAEVAEAYFDLVTVRARRALLMRQKESNEGRLALVRARVNAGVAGDIELRQQEQTVVGIEAQLAPLDALEAQTALRLSVLLGRAPGSRYGTAPEALVLPAPLDTDEVAADQLVERPDVRAAMLRLSAADQRTEAAIRTQMPQLRLSATPGYTYLQSERGGMQATASGFTWSVNGTLTVPLFDGLRQHGIVAQRRAEIDRRLAQLDRTLRLALVEATAALASEQQARILLTAVERQLALATSLREDAERQYQRGLTSFVNVLLAQVTEQTIELARLDAQRAVLAARVRYVRAVSPR